MESYSHGQIPLKCAVLRNAEKTVTILYGTWVENGEESSLIIRVGKGGELL